MASGLTEEGARAVASIVKQYVDAAFSDLRQRIDALPALEKGDPGRDGKDGIDGRDAPPVDVDAIIAGVLKMIPVPADGKKGDPGPKGEDGAAGRDGKDGANGMDGKDGAPGRDGKPGDMGISGKDGAPGKDGKPGDRGPAGEDGRDGRDGRNGSDGIDGKDALEIEPLNGMDEGASYQRGVWISHRGGLFRAFRTTDPVVDKNYAAAGWQVVVAGVADEAMTLQDDGRTVLRSLELTDGRTIVSKVQTFAQIHRGIYRRGLTYERGDTATWNGSCWHANRATDEEPSTDSKDWSLITRKGRDGKDHGA